MTGLRDNHHNEDNEEDKNENNHHCFIRRSPGAPSEMNGLRDIDDMIKIKIMTKVWTTRNLAMVITIMVMMMFAMLLLITERELSKYLVEGGIHLRYVGRLMLKYIVK